MRLRALIVSYRTEVVVFTVGAILFFGGLANVMLSNRNPRAGDLDLRPSVAGPAALGEVGPGPEEDLEAYISRKKQLLAERSEGAPAEESFAVASFDSYKAEPEVESFLKASKIDAHAIEVRIPLTGYGSELLPLQTEEVRPAVDAWRQRTLVSLKEELSELEKIIPTVTDREFKKVYQEDAESRRSAISILEGEGPVIFGLVARSTHAALSKAAQVPGIRLVDLPEDPGVTPDTHRFKAIAPS